MSVKKILDVLSPKVVVVACVAGLALWLFGNVIFLPNSFAYRDTAHFYSPLFEFTRDEWAAGRIPLWNPLENAGTPLAAIPTASVFYPGKLIFVLPLSFDWAFKCYVLLHVLLAAVAAYCLARRWERSVAAAGLAAISYAFCGSIMFQHCNVVFLCGAAWFPLALLAGARMIQERNLWWATVLGVILSMITLAGDAEMAYLAGVSIALLALLFGLDERRKRRKAEPKPTLRRKGRRSAARGQSSPDQIARGQLMHQRPFLLATAAGTGILLSSIQVLPTLELSRRTSRAAATVPRNVYGIPRYFWRASAGSGTPQLENGPTWYDAIIGRPSTYDSYELEITHFSVAPWRVLEFLFPNVGGKVFHQSQRLIPTSRAEHALWVPSMYMGLFPILLAIWSWRIRHTDIITRWTSWCVLLAIIGSFGAFGIGWLLRSVGARIGDGTDAAMEVTAQFPIGDSVGGLYWLLKNLLPGFSNFRYPAKLMGVAAAGLSILAAIGWDRVFVNGDRFPCRVFAVLTSVSLVAAVALLGLAPQWEMLIAYIHSDEKSGFAYPPGAYRDLLTTLIHTAFVCGVLWMLIGKHSGVRHAGSLKWLAPAALVLTSVDLAVANAWTILTAPSAEWHRPSHVARIIERSEELLSKQTGHPREPFRVFRMDFTPDASDEPSSNSPHRDGLRWEIDTLSPKYHLRTGIEMLTLEGTMLLHDYRQFFRFGMQQDPDGNILVVQPRRSFDAWGAKYFLLPRAENANSGSSLSMIGLRHAWRDSDAANESPSFVPQGPALGPPSAIKDESLAGLENGDVLYNSDSFPRAWIVHDVRAAFPIASVDHEQINAIVQAINFPRPESNLDLRKTAFIEDESLAASHAQRSLLSQDTAPNSGGEQCRVVRYESNHVEVEATLVSPGLVVLADAYYPGWQLEVETNGGPAAPMPILRTNRLMRGTLLPPGKHRLIFRYQPLSFRIGATISTISWIVFLGWAGYRKFKSFAHQSPGLSSSGTDETNHPG